MMRALQVLNLIGVLALAVLCGLQWEINSQLNLQAIKLEKSRLDQAAQLADRDKTIQGNVADLADFRRRPILSESQLKEIDDKLAKLTQAHNALIAQHQQLIAQRDQLKATLDRWIAAVAARDTVVKQANDQLQRCAADRDVAIAKFNDLVVKYNALVKRIEQTQ